MKSLTLKKIFSTLPILAIAFLPLTVSGQYISVTSADVQCYGNNDGSIDLTVFDGTTPYSYFWDNSATTGTDTSLTDSIFTLTGLSPATYSLTISEAGAPASNMFTTVTIAQPDQINFSSARTDVSLYDSSDGSIDLTITGGTTPYAYQWSTGGTDEDLASIPAGTYQITVTDANGCTQVSGNYPIEQPEPMITFYAEGFNEQTSNLGTIRDSVLFYLEDDTFSITSGALTESSHYTVANLPAGLSPSITIAGQYGYFTLTGTATNHNNWDGIDDLQLTFLDAAFTNHPASSVKAYSYLTENYPGPQAFDQEFYIDFYNTPRSTSLEIDTLSTNEMKRVTAIVSDTVNGNYFYMLLIKPGITIDSLKNYLIAPDTSTQKYAFFRYSFPLLDTTVLENLDTLKVTSEYGTDSRYYSIHTKGNPMSVNNTISLRENSDYDFTGDEFVFADPNGDAFKSLILVTVPSTSTYGALKYNGTNVTAGDTIPAGSLDQLNFKPLNYKYGIPFTSFSFKVLDAKDSASSAYTLTINVQTLGLVETIASYEFQSGLPTGWQNIGTDSAGVDGSSLDLWTHSETAQADISLLDDVPGFASATVDNGFMEFNVIKISDENHGGSYAGRTAYLVSDAIDCSENDNVILTFEQMLRCYTNPTDKFYVMVSTQDDITNTTAWTKYKIHKYTERDEYPIVNPDIAEINISDVAANQSEVYIAFVVDNADSYFWQIDDIRLLEYKHDIKFTELPYINNSPGSMNASGFSPSERRYGYRSMVPLMEYWVTGEGTETQGNGQFTFGAEFENNGSEPLYNVKLVSRIYHAETGICNYEMETGTIDTLLPGESSELHMDISPSVMYDYNGFNGGESGRFVFENYLVAKEFPDGKDNGIANSWDTVSVLINKGDGSDYGKGIFAKDGGPKGKKFNLSGVPGYGTKSGVEFGSRMIPARSHKAKAVWVYIDEDTEVGAIIKGRVYAVNLNAASDAEYWQSIGIQSEADTITEDELGSWVKLGLHDTYNTYKNLEANTEHLVAIEIVSDTLNFYTGEDVSKYRYYQMQNVYVAHGRGVKTDDKKTNWAAFPSHAQVPLIRLEVCQDCIYDFCEENPLDAECTDTLNNINNEKMLDNIYVGQNYPNPFSMNTVIPYEFSFNAEQVTVNIIDVAGIRVKTIDLGSVPAGGYNLNIDASDLKAGLYYYTFNIDGIIFTQRMMITN